MIDRFATARAFVAVARTLNFTRAAEVLGLSVGQLSRLIAGFEEETGRRLLHRTTRRVSLTTEGRAMLARVEALLAEADAIFSKDAAPTGELRVAASVPFFDMGITASVSAFLTENPGVKIRYEQTAEPLDLVRRAVDVGFQEGADPAEGYIAKPLGQIESWLCASPDYLARCGAPENLDELSEHRLVSLTGCRGEWHFMGTHDPERRVDLAVSPVFAANFSSVMLSVCLAGGGIAFQPVGATIGHVRAGRLRVVLPEWRGVPHVMNALVADRLNLSPLVRRFLDFVAERLPKNGTA